MFRRVRCAHLIPRIGQKQVRHVSMKELVLKHGLYCALYYWITNEMLVCVFTYLLHYGYLGKEDLIGFLENVGADKYLNLKNIETKSWSFFNGSLVISARLVANFIAASVFMSLFTPIQVPIAVATYPYLRRVLARGSKTVAPKTL